MPRLKCINLECEYEWMIGFNPVIDDDGMACCYGAYIVCPECHGRSQKIGKRLKGDI